MRGSIPRLGQEFKRSLVARGHNFCGMVEAAGFMGGRARLWTRPNLFKALGAFFCHASRGAAPKRLWSPLA
jgi:hypothetical protein